MNTPRFPTSNCGGLFPILFFAGMVGSLCGGETGTAADPAAAPVSTAASGGASGGSHSHADLAKQATNPAAPLIQLQLQNLFIPDSIDADGYANQFIVQPVIPIAKMGLLPRSILRPTIPVVSSPDVGGEDGTTGLGDISWVYIWALDQDWGVFGLGGAGAIPTSSDLRLGARKWTLGPSFFAMYTKIPNVQFGALVSNTWDVGGAGPNGVNKMSIQGIFNYHWGEGWYAGWGDQAITFDWQNDDNVYFPISARVGKVFSVGKQKVNAFLQGHYNVGDDVTGQDQWGIKLNFTLLFPE